MEKKKKKVVSLPHVLHSQTVFQTQLRPVPRSDLAICWRQLRLSLIHVWKTAPNSTFFSLLSPVSWGFPGSRVWCAGRISNLVWSEVLASNCVASRTEQCSVLVPSIDRIWSPTCNAPDLRGKQRTARTVINVGSVRDNIKKVIQITILIMCHNMDVKYNVNYVSSC